MKALRVLLLLSLAAGSEAAAKPEAGTGRESLIFQADRLDFDRERNVVTAESNVELARDGRILRADRVVLDRTTGIARAVGNVTLLERNGEVLFADSVELTDDLRNGFVEQFKARLGPGSRLAASWGQLHEGTRADLSQGVFSACRPCSEDPHRAPIWQVKARRVTHDRIAKEVIYRDAVLEMWGVPTLYTPYLRHPDPTVDRRSGFLAPTIEHESDLGVRIGTPWFWNIAPDRDATFVPIVASKRGFVGAGEYRQLFDRGRLEVSGSLAALDREPKERTGGGLRGHLRLKGEAHANANWRIRGEFYRASDDGYLDLTGIDGSETLSSFAEAEGFFDRAYARVGLFDVQELREGVSGDMSPLAAPEILYEWRSDPSPAGIWSMQAAGAALHRRRKDENQRVMLGGNWQLQRFTDGGHRLDLGAGIRGDFAHGDRVREDSNTRLLPLASAGWSFLLAGGYKEMQLTVEPRAQIVLGRNSADADDFPNEDGQAVEFEFANLFAINRFPGLDGVETGQRVDYGLQLGLHGLHGLNDWHIDAGIGQSRRRKANRDAPPGSGLDTTVSDLVGRVDLTAGDMTALSYRFRLDKDDLTARQTALNLSATWDPIRLEARYARAVPSAGDVGGAAVKREQIDMTLHSTMGSNWSGFGRHRRDLDADGTLLNGIGLKYEDECLFFETVFERQFDTPGGDADNRIMVRIVFRDLESFPGRKKP